MHLKTLVSNYNTALTIQRFLSVKKMCQKGTIRWSLSAIANERTRLFALYEAARISQIIKTEKKCVLNRENGLEGKRVGRLCWRNAFDLNFLRTIRQ